VDRLTRPVQIIRRQLGEVLSVSPAPKALGRASVRGVRRPARVRAIPRDRALDERLRRLGVGR
jgi:hypothetical protein